MPIKWADEDTLHLQWGRRSCVKLIRDMKMYGRFAWGLRGFLRRTITLEEARATIRDRLAAREENFLRLIRRGVFGYRRSPYLPLLKLAGCEMGDVETMVRDRGLEGTLLALREAGVCVTFEEFKGPRPIVREGREFPVAPDAFDNPFVSASYCARSGGTTGAGTRVPMDLEHLAAQSPYVMLAHEAHGILHAPTAVWLPILPDGSGLNCTLRHARIGQMPQKWFTPLVQRELRPSLKNPLAMRMLGVLSRLYGRPVPHAEPVPLDQAAVVARWAADAIKNHGSCLILVQVSNAARISIAAREEGLNLTGAVLWGGGEPPTPAKVAEMRRSGARWVPGYWITEVGNIGLGCAAPEDDNDIHFFKDALALIQYPRQVPGSDITVDAIHFTTLLPTSPKLMLNVESDDYGVVETRDCGCPLGRLGFTEHIRHIRSFRKLTGEGVTLVGSEMVHVLEEVLPARFGGTPLDYQLAEEEDESGFTRLSVLVSPRVRIESEAAVVDAVLEAMRRSSVAANMAAAVWAQADTLRVKRMDPVSTRVGKLMPLHMLDRRKERTTWPPAT